MDIEPLLVPGSFLVKPKVHGDNRGEFVEWFRADLLNQATGLDFSVAQASLSLSAKGTLRGIHFADVPPGQAKYVMCSSGSIEDYVVDIRVGSPTFGAWDRVAISASERNAIVLDVGLGHAFLALEDNTTVTYLVTDRHKPLAEHGINPFDSDLKLDFSLPARELLFSEKDAAAPGFFEAQASGLLPKWRGLQN